jgi:hypothetical protein
MTLTDLRREPTANLKLIAAIGHQFHVDFYLEPLAWTPLSALSDVLRVLDDAGQENVGLAIDFWHLWSVGTDPGDVARIEGKIIRSIDVCLREPISAVAASGPGTARSRFRSGSMRYVPPASTGPGLASCIARGTGSSIRGERRKTFARSSRTC